MHHRLKMSDLHFIIQKHKMLPISFLFILFFFSSVLILRSLFEHSGSAASYKGGELTDQIIKGKPATPPTKQGGSRKYQAHTKRNVNPRGRPRERIGSTWPTLLFLTSVIFLSISLRDSGSHVIKESGIS